MASMYGRGSIQLRYGTMRDVAVMAVRSKELQNVLWMILLRWIRYVLSQEQTELRADGAVNEPVIVRFVVFNWKLENWSSRLFAVFSIYRELQREFQLNQTE